MRVVDVLALYALLGALLVFAARRSGALRRGRAVDHLLALVLWPLYVPALLRPPAVRDAPLGGPQRIPEEQQQLFAALDAVADPALVRLLPGRDALRHLFSHLGTLQQKVEELDEVLLRPEFSSARDSRAPGDPMVDETVRRLVLLRERAARERDDLLRLCTRLRLQLTLLRFEGSAQGDISELVSEILARVEVACGVPDRLS